ncbi:restriction endonuclease subunit S, partial [Rhodosalinus sp. FB01]|uniref:restriction endonuclease subunit S n=1 Tax=Rhodosalinus sp. FB01 TaxID=3239194 RepID=UPI003526A76C
MSDLVLAFPPLPEQRAIAAFLDRETGKIDALVEEQRRLIALLKEKRQAVISHAVTKTLDPTAPMKDSGVKWLGEIPAHWSVRGINSVSTKITNGYVGPTRDILRDEGVRYLQSLHIKRNQIIFDRPYYVDGEWSDGHSKSILKAEDVLIVQTGDIGQVAVVPPEFEGCNCHALIIVSPILSEVTGRWMSWVLTSEFGQNSLRSIQTGALHPHLNCGNVKFLALPIPPLEEQEVTIQFLTGELEKMDALISEELCWEMGDGV